jgi:PAS domain S-box-containing protein
MRRPPPTPLSPAHDYTPDIDLLRDQLTTLTRRWCGVAPTPPFLSEAVEELTATVEELEAMNADLTQSQQAIITSQQRYQELFEGVPEAYLVTDVHGLIQEANRPAAHLFNIGRSQLAGIPLGVFIAQDMRRDFWAQFARLRTGAEVREWIIRVQPRHGPAVTVTCRVAPALDTEGRLIGLRWLLRDYTAQQYAQETLEQRVQDLTLQLEHAQSALQVMQNRTDLRVRELHHRMKNDLQVISSLLDWEEQDLQDPRARTIFETCQGRIRAMAVIHELLYRAGDLERVELGRYLGQLALQVFEAHGVDRERVHLEVQCDPITLEVRTAMPCGLLVHELLSNCLQHAFRAPHAGVVTITLRAALAGQVTLTVRDTGVGLPPDREARKGESFGLHLVRALAEQLQGAITFTHERGTCVTLTFPLS